MVNTTSEFSSRFTPKRSASGIDPGSIRNEVLLSLPPKESDALFSPCCRSTPGHPVPAATILTSPRARLNPC